MHRRVVQCGMPAVLMAICQVAAGVPQETATFQSVDSIGEFTDIGENEARVFEFTGAYSVARLRVSGTLQSLNNSTWRTDARVAITAPGQGVMIVQPFDLGNEFTLATVTDRVFTLGAPVAASGEWQFRFFETIWDGVTADARWQSISFTLDDEGIAPGEVLTPSGTGVYTEIEDNDSKPRANRILSVAAGQAISGVTTGASSSPGLASLDYFRIKTAPAALGIYRHRLILTSSPSGHVGSLRGLGQVNGVIQDGTDIEAQGSISSTVPARMNQWYGFGKQEEVYYRVAGSLTTTAAYSAAYTVSAVTPLLASRTFAPGALAITTIGQGHTTDTDLWIYDSQLNPIAGYGNDDAVNDPNNQSTLGADFAAGEYYIAVVPYNLANNLASTNGAEGFRNGDVTDFANCVVQDAAETGVPMSLSIADGAGVVPVPATRAGPFDVVWIKFVVGEPACPADVDDGTGTNTPDGAVTIDDLLYYLAVFEEGSVAADLDNDGDPAEGVPDGAVTIDDLLFFLARFEAGC